jgi:hypothetical protein
VRTRRARGGRERGSVVVELLARVAGRARLPSPRFSSVRHTTHRQLGPICAW